jgi:hypothetical protein
MRVACTGKQQKRRRHEKRKKYKSESGLLSSRITILETIEAAKLKYSAAFARHALRINSLPMQAGLTD